MVPKAIQTAAEVKRAFYKLPQRRKGTEEVELFQYIKMDTDDSGVAARRSPSPQKREEDSPGGRPVIKLNEAPEPESPRKGFGRLWPTSEKKEKENPTKSELKTPRRM